MSKKKKIHGNTKYPYNPLYPQMLLDFFSPPYYTIKDITITKADGTQIDKTEMEALPPRFLSQFATSIGIKLISYRQTFKDWGEKYTEFGDALKIAKELENEMVRTNALMGLYPPAFSIFTMKNIAGWRDTHEVTNKGAGNKTYIVNQVKSLETSQAKSRISVAD